MGLREKFSKLGTGEKIIVGGVVLIVGGGILLVLLTILAAIVGSFVIGTGTVEEKPPQAQFEFDRIEDGNTVEIQHQGGDSIETNKLSIERTGSAGDTKVTWADGGDGMFQAGDTVSFPYNEGTYRLTYALDSGETVVIAQWER